MNSIKNLLVAQGDVDAPDILDMTNATLQQRAAQQALTKAETEFDQAKQYHLEQLLKMETKSFIWFMENLVLPCIKTNVLQGSASIDNEKLYELCLSDGMSELYVEYLKAKRRLTNAT